MITLTEENYLKAILAISLNTDDKVSTNAIADEISKGIIASPEGESMEDDDSSDINIDNKGDE